MTMTADVIDALVRIAPGSPLDQIRRRRSQARDNAQASYEALFAPADPRGVALAERFAVAAFVAGLSGAAAAHAHYAQELSRLDPPLAEALAQALGRATAPGPYGVYPKGPLSREDVPGPTYAVDAGTAERLGARLAAALEHAHLLVLHPRDAAQSHVRKLADSGWTTPQIVTLSQIVAFVSFQARLIAGLSQLNAS
jgi:CMD domain protein